MSTPDHVTETERGYLSTESKRRFTLIAGVLGAVFFLAQTLLPMALMFVLMVPMMFRSELSIIDLDQAVTWRDELWFTQQTVQPNWGEPEARQSRLALSRVRLADLSSAGPPVPIDDDTGSSPALLAGTDRLWIIGASTTGYYRDGALTRLSVAERPSRPSRPFLHGGRPAVLSLGASPALATLQVEGTGARWITDELPLHLPTDQGTLRGLQGVESGGQVYLFTELCTEAPDHCSVSYRQLERDRWTPFVAELCSCGSWTAVVAGSRPGVVVSEPVEKDKTRVALVTLEAAGPVRTPLEVDSDRWMLGSWRPVSSDGRIVLAAQGMPGSLRLAEFEDGRRVRSVRRPGSFPFGPNMMAVMAIPQLLPIVLSLVLAFLLTIQMRRHRVQEYAFADRRRTFASLWQRALAQLVDLIPFLVGFAAPAIWWWRMMSDPERFLESGRFFPLVFFGVFLAAFAWAVLLLMAYSYAEGRFGKTPGKWLLRIRVLGTDLQPCGFKRAFVRNLLTFVDGFFSFLVGALLVALTENWQRLGDLAARTIVVVDPRPAGPS